MANLMSQLFLTGLFLLVSGVLGFQEAQKTKKNGVKNFSIFAIVWGALVILQQLFDISLLFLKKA